MKRRRRSNRSIAGFTLIEMLLIIIIIGILFAIAAPGWDTLLSRQRVSSAREQVLQVIRQAQSEARTTRAFRAVVFDNNSPDGVPRVATLPLSVSPNAYPINATTVTNWRSLAGSGTPSGAIRLTTNNSNNQIVFDGNGAVAQGSAVDNLNQFNTIPSSTDRAFAVTIARGGTTGNATKRCVLVTTLLGATRLEEGANCP